MVLITGSSRGIGEATAYEFSRERARVVVTYYKDRKRAESTYRKCLDLSGSDGLLLELNVMDDATINRCVETVVAAFGKIDALVNNAGRLTWTRLRNQTADDIQNQVRTNLEGSIKMIRACLPYITETIINIGSIAGKNGIEELTVVRRNLGSEDLRKR